MHDVAKYDEVELDKFLIDLIHKIYYEFCYKQRDQRIWEAGFETYNKIGAYNEKDHRDR